jgi:hypothetical protein
MAAAIPVMPLSRSAHERLRRLVSSPPRRAPVPPGPAATTPPSQLTTFTGTYFSIDYPSDWYVASREEQRPGFLDTTIRHPTAPSTLIRVDVSPGARLSDPAQGAIGQEQGHARLPGYRRLGWGRTTLAGYPAFRWEFVEPVDGLLVRKVDIFLSDGAGNGIAVLTQAPEATYAQWLPTFQEVYASFRPTSFQAAPSMDEEAAVASAVRAHWEAINRGDYELAYDSFSPRLQSTFSRQGWVRDKLIDRPKASAITVSSVSVQGQVAYAQVSFTTVGRKTGPGNTGCNAWSGSYRLVRIAGGWYIDRSLLRRTSLSCGD